VEVVETELILADLEILSRQRLKLEKRAKVGDKAAAAALPVMTKSEEGLNQGKWARDVGLTPPDLEYLKEVALLTLKPYLFVANLSEAEFHGGPHYRALQALAAERGVSAVPLLGDLEAELMELSEPERREFLESVGLAEPGINRLIRESYRLLNLVTFYTVVGPEVRAWTVPAGTAAPKAAGRVHSDMEKGFIRAEVMRYDDLVRLGSPAKIKEAGLIQVEGRDYQIHDADILTFRFQR
jgi:GTP-binding protein YchF